MPVQRKPKMTLVEEFCAAWRVKELMNPFLSRFVVATSARAAGCWKLENGHLDLFGFGWVSDMADEVSQGFQDATRHVSLDQMGLGIVKAVATQAPTIGRRDPTLTGLDRSASWIVKFDANTSLAIPIRGAKSSKILGALAVSTTAFVESGDSLWRTLEELTEAIGRTHE